jgi:NAD-dependent SIR2 family protein deacetylase
VILAGVSLATDSIDELDRLADFVGGGNVVVLTGAGLSTESGIPDYRGPDGKRRVTPMTYGEFVASAENRRRYWARSYVGWRRFAAAGPNRGHEVVAALQHAGHVRTLITQNVDGLHQSAGARDVLELHGNLERVLCLQCGDRSRRVELDTRLREANPDFEVAVGEIRPDGDVVLPEDAVARFHPPRCLVCGSDQLKPDVVFFGESVPKPLVAQCFAEVEACDGLVVLGSSLQVMSGYRFVRRAAAHGIPVAIVTRGASRGDGEATIRVDAALGATLTELAHRVGLTRYAVPSPS